MTQPTHMDLDGKGAYLTRLKCASYGNKVVYNGVWFEYDGIERQAGEHYSELDTMLVKAGYDKPDYGHSKIIDMPRVPVLLEAHNNSYRIAAITDAKGKPIVTRQQVIEERAERGKELSALGNKYAGIPISQRFGMARREMVAKQAQPDTQATPARKVTADSPIFAHGERVIREWLAERAGFEAQVYDWLTTTTLKPAA